MPRKVRAAPDERSLTRRSSVGCRNVSPTLWLLRRRHPAIFCKQQPRRTSTSTPATRYKARHEVSMKPPWKACRLD
ncbi:hypothetical protein DOTSEDRAFT_74930 [Dothistroma septosporum NZE10]|uniref:Uncharacterized protein n=1 Tax=Dothistroma septosporum (strain NZE10 / CBS 128990) TaxID=675120 RepID=N1PCM8_DOTSN|nr:hypothetical protein DOTSEDRAFT_74930 [Dothistroma septosporum NZE10]